MSSLEIEGSGFEVWSFVCGAFCVCACLCCVVLLCFFALGLGQV